MVRLVWLNVAVTGCSAISQCNSAHAMALPGIPYNQFLCMLHGQHWQFVLEDISESVSDVGSLLELNVSC